MASLVADIGATNARFQLCDAGGLLGAPVVLSVTDFTDQAVMVRNALTRLREEAESLNVERALFAVAGPHQGGGQFTLTNTGLKLSESGLSDALQCTTRLVNDFYAQAAFVPHAEHLAQVGGGEPHGTVKAVLGPGSGLGMASLAQTNGRWRIMSGEGGHADFSPGSHLEVELWSTLSQRFSHISWETLLSGAGLQNLYWAMCQVWGAKPDELSAAQISDKGLNIEDPVCHQTLETFFALLGSAAGNLALTLGARGGVYIAGGIVPQMVDYALQSPLRRRFDEKGQMSAYVKAIPLYIVTDDVPGLKGARICLFEDL